MTIKMNLQNVKDRVKDDTLDLSLCELVQVPVKEIVTIRKVVNLDLSNNLLVSLPKNFTTLTQIVKLDLSRNMLTEIPESIGEMKRLKHLDLYANQISRLPLSMGELRNLRWLDLKENPLTPAVASVAGPCSDAKECQDCARNVVAYLANVKMQIEQETLRRLNEVPANEVEKESTGKKEGRKKKKKHADKENKKNVNTNGCELKKEDLHIKQEYNEETVTVSKFISEEEEEPNICVVEVDNKGENACCRLLRWTVLWPLILAFFFSIFIAVFPLLDKERSIHFMGYVRHTTGLDLKPYQKYSTDMLHHVLDLLSVWVNCIFKVVNDTLERYTADNVDDTKKEF